VNGVSYEFKFRFWTNNQSRMYLIEGCSDLLKKYKLSFGDVIVFARKDDGTLVLGGRPAGPVWPGSLPSLILHLFVTAQAVCMHSASRCTLHKWSAVWYARQVTNEDSKLPCQSCGDLPNWPAHSQGLHFLEHPWATLLLCLDCTEDAHLQNAQMQERTLRSTYQTHIHVVVVWSAAIRSLFCGNLQVGICLEFASALLADSD
jgi:hypothetical protein